MFDNFSPPNITVSVKQFNASHQLLTDNTFLLAHGSFFCQGGEMPAFINVIITGLIWYVSVPRLVTKNLILHQDTGRETRNVEQHAFTITHDDSRRWNGVLLSKDAKEMKPVNCMLRVQSQNMMMIVTGTWEMMKKVYTSAGNSTSCLGVLHDVTLRMNPHTMALTNQSKIYLRIKH